MSADAVHNANSMLLEAIYSLFNMCVFLFFSRRQLIDLLFLQCQFATALPFWLPSNESRDLIGQGCAFRHPGSDSQLANDFCAFAHCRWTIEELNIIQYPYKITPDPKV